MRINQIVAAYSAQVKQSMQSGTANGPQVSRQLDKAQRNNQARLDDAAKGYIQASAVKEGAGKTEDAVAQALKQANKAADPKTSAADRKTLQEDFKKALSAVDQGAKDQKAALADKDLANKVVDTSKVKVREAKDLGTGASQKFKSVEDLKSLDLSTASNEDLAEAAKVLKAAQEETKSAQDVAEAGAKRVSSKVAQYQTAQNALEGSLSPNERQRNDLDTINALLRSKPPSGSLFSGYG